MAFPRARSAEQQDGDQHRNNRLRRTHNPVNLASVRRFDEARFAGARRLQEQQPDKRVSRPALPHLFGWAPKADRAAD
jgi:hypothetical protein